MLTPRQIVTTAAVLVSGAFLSPLAASEPPRPPEPQEQVLSASAATQAVSANLGGLSELTTTTTVSPTASTQPTTTTTTEAPAPVSAPVSAPEPPAPVGECGGYGSLVQAYWPADQVAKACAVMGCETGYTYSPTEENPSSSASGLFQFLDGTWQSARQYVEGASQYARASHAPAETQIAVGAAWWSRTSWSQWECA